MRVSTTWKGSDSNASTMPGLDKGNTHTLEYRLIYSVVFGVSFILTGMNSLVSLVFSNSDKKTPSALSEARSIANSAVPYIYQH